MIESHTKKDERYDGLQNLYHLHVTILNSKVNGARIDRIRYFNRLDQEKSSQMREKSFQEMSAYAQYFVSYYSPDKDLQKLPNMWNFYLEHNGVKYEGKVRHVTKRSFEIRRLYPHIDRWSKPYIIEFPIPMSEVEKNPSTFIMTGAAGTSQFTFSPSL